jgi:hypothetical protein
VNPLDDLRTKIEAQGWAVRNVSDSDPAKCLSYTVGLTAHAHPEVVMTGLPPEVGTAFLNIVGEIVVRDGGRFAAGDATTELADGPAMPVLAVLDTTDLTAVDAADRSRLDDYHLAEGSGLAARCVATPDGVGEEDAMDGPAYERWVAGYDVATGAAKGRLRTDEQVHGQHPAPVAPARHLPRIAKHQHLYLTHEQVEALAIASGADVKVVQQMLGHSSATMTLDTYGHLFTDRLDEVATAMNAARAAAQQRRNELRALPRVARAPPERRRGPERRSGPSQRFR